MDESPFSTAEAFREAHRRAGGYSALARICGCTPPNIQQHIEKGNAMPAEFVLPVEAATRVSRHELRPDLYPREGCCAQACPEHGDSAPLQPSAARVGAAGGSSDSRADSSPAQPPAGSAPFSAGGSHTPDALAGVRS